MLRAGKVLSVTKVLKDDRAVRVRWVLKVYKVIKDFSVTRVYKVHVGKDRRAHAVCRVLWAQSGFKVL